MALLIYEAGGGYNDDKRLGWKGNLVMVQEFTRKARRPLTGLNETVAQRQGNRVGPVASLQFTQY